MMRVLVVGGGGLGGVMAARLAPVADVTLVSTNAAIRHAIDAAGVVAEVDGRLVRGAPTVVAEAPAGAGFHLAILATQPPSVEDAARATAPALADDARVLVVQNGLCEERVAAVLGAERVVGGVVAWGATMDAPGRYRQTARGGFTLGRIGDPAPAMDPGLLTMAALLRTAFPVRLTGNLRGVRFSKLALNAAISSIGTIAGEPLGPLVAEARYRQLALEVMTEAVRVAAASGVTLERVAGTLDLGWIALTEPGRRRGMPLALRHALLRAVGLRYRAMRSSMLAAIERGRPPAVDFLNGELVTRGAAAGVATPVNAAIVDAVWRIARGEHASSRAALDEVAAIARAAAAVADRAA
jgi:2-dehydropantoate 2-reductase